MSPKHPKRKVFRKRPAHLRPEFAGHGGRALEVLEYLGVNHPQNPTNQDSMTPKASFQNLDVSGTFFLRNTGNPEGSQGPPLSRA